MRYSPAHLRMNRFTTLVRNSFIFLLFTSWLYGTNAWANELKPETSAAFDRYARVTETQRDQETRDGHFLAVDGLPDAQRREAYDQLQHGQVFIQELHILEDHLPIRIPGGMIHHWSGLIFIPKATVSEVNAVLQDYQNEASIYQPEIRKADLIEQHGNKSRILLQMYTKSIITVVLDGYFEVIETPIGNTRMESASRSTRIAEVVKIRAPPMSMKAPKGTTTDTCGASNSYWRLEEKDGGVYVQNESITLTRSVPVLLAWLINPLTKSIPRDVIIHMLTDTQKAVSKTGAAPK